MDQGQVAHYRNQNVRFDVDFIAKSNVSLGKRKCSKRVGNFECRKLLGKSVGYGLILSDHKRRKRSPRNNLFLFTLMHFPVS